MFVGSAPGLRSVCIKLLGVIFVGAAQMNKGNLTLEMMFTPCKCDHCFGKSRKLLII